MPSTRTEQSDLAGSGGRPAAEPVEVESLVVDFGGPPVLRSVTLRVEAGGILALLGPSGCGKTTLLRTIAGLEEPVEGLVRVGDRLLSEAGRTVPPERRDVAMVFQDWALFPHLTVAENVGFALPRGQRRVSRTIDETLELVGLSGFENRMPDSLSGGQQQRVALGRALAQRPSVLLLDEPFSNLDAGLRTQVRADVHELLARVGVTTVLVTHDRDEAFVFGDRVAVMRDGCIVQAGAPRDVYLRSVDEWVAAFVGELNLLDGSAKGLRACTALGWVDLVEPRQGPVRVGVRPQQVSLSHAGEGADAKAGEDLPARVDLVEYHGPRTTYRLSCEVGSLVAEAAGPPQWQAGDLVHVTVSGVASAWAVPPVSPSERTDPDIRTGP